MMVNALSHLTDLPTEIITFSDDMDGLRKVPENIPQKELLEKNLHKNRLQKSQILLVNLVVLENIIMKCLKIFK